MGGDNKSHLDPTSEIRVGNFSGENDKWPSWCLKFESYCDLVDWGEYTLRAERSLATTVASVPEAAQPRVACVRSSVACVMVNAQHEDGKGKRLAS